MTEENGRPDESSQASRQNVNPMPKCTCRQGRNVIDAGQLMERRRQSVALAWSDSRYSSPFAMILPMINEAASRLFRPG